MRILPIVVSIALGCVALSTSGSQVYGASDCGSWLGAKAEPISRRGQELWLVGYLSGRNVMHDRAKLKPTDPLGRLGSTTQVFVWMDNYCQVNPLKWVVQGADDLWIEITSNN